MISPLIEVPNCLKLCTNHIAMGNGGPKKRGQMTPMYENAPVLITVETHSVIGTGELVHGTTPVNEQVRCCPLSVVSNIRSCEPLEKLFMIPRFFRNTSHHD